MLFLANYSKKYDIVSLPLFFHKNSMIQPGLATVQSSISTTDKKYQMDLRWSC